MGYLNAGSSRVHFRGAPVEKGMMVSPDGGQEVLAERVEGHVQSLLHGGGISWVPNSPLRLQNTQSARSVGVGDSMVIPCVGLAHLSTG